MHIRSLQPLWIALGATALAATAAAVNAEAPAPPWIDWTTVVNNNDLMPGAPVRTTFNSYNQPSVNDTGWWSSGRAAGRTGGPAGATDPRHLHPRHGGRRQPHRQDPRPDHAGSVSQQPGDHLRRDPVLPAHRHELGHHRHAREPPAGVEYIPDDGTETRAGTTGIYTNPFDDLITGAAKLGAVPDFAFFAVPELDPATTFEVFPGRPR